MAMATSNHGISSNSEGAVFSTTMAQLTATLKDGTGTTDNTSHWLNSTFSKNGLCYALNSTREEDIDKINQYLYQHIFLPSLILSIFLFIVGILGNTVVFYVYLRKWRRSSSRIFILALAGFDLINCSILPIEMAIMTHLIKFDHPGLCKFSRWLTFTMNNCSSLTLVVIAVDRYIRICLPTKTPLSNKQAKIWIIIAIVLSLATTWPSIVFFGTTTSFIATLFPGVCVVGKLCLLEEKYVHSPYRFYFKVFLLVGTLLIDIVLIACYSRVTYILVKRGDFAAGRSNSRKDSMVSCSTENDAVNLEADSSSQTVTKQLTFKFNKETFSQNEDNAIGIELKSSQNEYLNKKPKGSENKELVKREGWFSGSMKLFQPRPGSENRSVGKNSTKNRRKTFQSQRSLSIQSIDKRRSHMYRTTLMLLSITLLFIISFVSYCVIVIVQYLNPLYYISLTMSGKASYQFFLRTYLLSSALNPVIYSFLSEQFRAESKTLFRKIFEKCGLIKCWCPFNLQQ